MAKTVGIGHQDFEKIRETNNFYIDKAAFIREWREANDSVTLITRPRCFGKTLNVSIIEFKVQDMDEKELTDTVREALQQIEEKNYQAMLIAKGIPKERIRKYGFAFGGKKVLIGEGVPKENIITIALDDDVNVAYREPGELSKYIRAQVTDKEGMFYILRIL